MDGSRSNIYPFMTLLRQRPLITVHNPPNYYAYTPHLNRLRFFHFKLEYHVCLTYLHPNRENNTTRPGALSIRAKCWLHYPRAGAGAGVPVEAIYRRQNRGSTQSGSYSASQSTP